MNSNNIIVFAGRSGEQFKKLVVRNLIKNYNYDPRIDGIVDSSDFNCGEISVQLKSNSNRKMVHLFQCFYDPINDYLNQNVLNSNLDEDVKKEVLMRCLSTNRDFVEMLVIGDAIVRAKGSEVNLYMPMYPYARQDRKSKGREPITASLVADLIKATFEDKLAGVNVAELHVDQIQGLFKKPVNTIPMHPFYAMAVKYYFPNLDNIVLVSPDAGGVTRTKRIGDLVGVPVANIHKRRSSKGVAEAESVVGDVKDKIAILVDDIADSSGSLVKAYEILREYGAKPEVYAIITNPLMSISYDKKGNRRIAEELLKGKIQLITTNVVPRTIEYYKKHAGVYKAVIDMSGPFADLLYCNIGFIDEYNQDNGSFSNKIEEYVEKASEFERSYLEDILIKF